MNSFSARLLLLLLGSTVLSCPGQAFAQPVPAQITAQPTIQCIKAPCLPSSTQIEPHPLHQPAIQCFVAPCELPQPQTSQDQQLELKRRYNSYPPSLLEYLF